MAICARHAEEKVLRASGASVCRSCHRQNAARYRQRNPATVRTSNRRYYTRNAPKWSADQARRVERARAIVAAEVVRRGECCLRCGRPHEAGFHWHHRDPKTKEFNISRGWSHSTRRLVLELAKCDLLCPSCHSKITRGAAA